MTVYDEATDMIIIRDKTAEAFEYNDGSLKDLKWLIQDQPIFYKDSAFIFLDRKDGIYLRDMDSRTEKNWMVRIAMYGRKSGLMG
ncbi:hypothetical protein [Dehalobacterium formicoaceticum]|uniref:hypothetical protein n=1 Tax=Dehalobacterium formicoaceticum TaxID=51515 RepID=UPI000B7E1ECC|nr:hypothetical protein [Dehalobacterium formicoaceticum]